MNNKIKLINTGKCNILAMMVPDGTTKFRVDHSYPLQTRILYFPEGKMGESLFVDGYWQIVGIDSELTEEQWRELMLRTKSFLSGVFPVFHYSGFETAKESGLSLLEANGITEPTLILKQL